MDLTKLNNLKGCKNSKNRNAIIEILGNVKEPVTADFLHQKLRKINPSVSTSTVYRGLEKLVSASIVTKSIIMDQNKAIYELNKENHQHYLICVKCNNMIPITKCPFDNLAKEIHNETGFKITGHKFEIYGHCEKCCDSKKES